MAEQEFYVNLRSKALMTAEMVLHDEANMQPLESLESEQDTTLHPLPFRENIVIFNAQMKRVFAFNHAAAPFPERILTSFKSGLEERFQDGKLMGIAIHHKSDSGHQYLIVAESIFSTEDLGKLRNILIITFFMGIGIVALGGWIYAGQAMSPVARIVNQVDNIIPSDLSARLNLLNSHDELSRLVQTFNRLLDRIQFAFRMQKSFISNVSHELKNPLSVIISQLEIALDKSSRNELEYRETLTSVLEDTRELNEISEKLLQLARIHSDGGNICFESVRLDEALLQTRATLLRLHPEYQISFDIVGAPEHEDQLCVMANESLLRSAFLNLMDNGCKFSPDKRVDSTIIFGQNGQHRVEITDHGPGIPEQDLHLVFQPFYRSAQSIHIRGSGIGLSLVESILRLHRVALDVVSEKGIGTTFKLNFPTDI
jgi:signal transduction histidine kinase